MHLGDDVELEYYRLRRMSEDSILVSEGEGVYVTSLAEVGTGDPEEDKAPLSEIIARLNDRFGTDFTDEDRLFFEQPKERAVRDEGVRRIVLANAYDKFALGFRPQLGKIMVERMGENDAIVTRFLDDADFQQTASEVLAREVYEAVGGPRGSRVGDSLLRHAASGRRIIALVAMVASSCRYRTGAVRAAAAVRLRAMSSYYPSESDCDGRFSHASIFRSVRASRRES